MTEHREAREPHGNIEVFAEIHGIDLPTCRQSALWAREWSYLLETAVGELGSEADIDASFIKTAREEAARDLGERLPRDHNGVPSFRAEFAATEMLYRGHPDGDVLRDILEGSGPHPVPHFGRLDVMLDTLLAERANNRFPYYLDAAQLPQDERNMPPELPRGGAEHANFLFATCYYMRGGIKSFAAFRGLSALYSEDPTLFDPNEAKDRDPALIAKALEQVGLGFSKNVIAGQWVRNAERLSELYDGDVRRVFDGTTDYSELLRRIQNKNGRGFAGFQEKMTSMLAYYLMAEKLIPYFDFPLPVDFHVLRVSAANQIITFENLPEDSDIYHEKTLAMLRAMYHDYSVTHGVSQLDVCDAVWSLSSAICGSQPGNIMLEPNKSEGRQGRSTLIYPLEIDVNDPNQQRMYERSCALCPLEDSCELNFPSKRYYVQGKMIGTPRIRFPRTTLF